MVTFHLLAGEGKLRCLSCVEVDIYPKHIEICTGLILNTCARAKISYIIINYQHAILYIQAIQVELKVKNSATVHLVV